MNTKEVNISFPVLILVVVLIVIVVMAYTNYKAYNEKKVAVSQIKILTDKISSLEEQGILTEDGKINTNKLASNNSSEDVDVLTKNIQEVYDKAYDIIKEGAGLTDGTMVTNSLQDGNTVTAYKYDFSIIEPYFTVQELDQIKADYTNTPSGYSDGNYYIYEGFEGQRKDFISTVFGVTNQEKRTLEIMSYSDNIILAKSKKIEKETDGKYMIFQKVDGDWKIDLFE